MSEGKDNPDGQPGTNSPSNSTTESIRVDQQKAEKVSVPKPDYILIDSCVLVREPSFYSTFNEMFTEEKLKLYLQEQYSSPVVSKLVEALFISPIADVPPLKKGDGKKVTIAKLTKCSQLPREVVYKVIVLKNVFIDLLQFYAEKKTFRLEMNSLNIKWIQHWRQKKITFALVSSLNPDTFKSFLTCTAEFGNIADLFKDIYLQSREKEDYQDESFFEKLGKHLMKRYDNFTLISKHLPDIKEAFSAGYKVFHYASEKTEFPRLSKLNDLSFEEKV